MKKSFGLIEVVVSLGIITLVLGALLGLTSAGTKLSVGSEKRLQAVDIARAGIDAIGQNRDTYRLQNPTSEGIGLPYGSLYTIIGYSPGVPTESTQLGLTCSSGGLSGKYVQKVDSTGTWTNNLVCDVEMAADDFGLFVQITDVDTANPGTLLKALVSVDWKEGNKLKSINIIRYYTKWR